MFLVRFLIFILCLVAVTGCKSSTDEPVKAERVYRIGYMICNSEAETLSRFQPLTAYLSNKMGVRFEAVAIDTINFMKEVETLDFTHTNSLLYIMMNRFHAVQVLAGKRLALWGANLKEQLPCAARVIFGI